MDRKGIIRSEFLREGSCMGAGALFANVAAAGAADCQAAPCRQVSAGAGKCAFSRQAADAARLNVSSRGVERYAKRMLVENNIEDHVNFFHIDALSSAVAVKINWDVNGFSSNLDDPIVPHDVKD